MSSLERDSLHRIGRNRNGGAAARALGRKRNIRRADLCAVLNSVKRTLSIREARISKSNVNGWVRGRGWVDDHQGVLGGRIERGRGQAAAPGRSRYAFGHVAAPLEAEIRGRSQ